MTDALIFSFGSILFIITTAATFSFGLRRMHEGQADDMAEAGGYRVPRPDGFTELHVAYEGLERRDQRVDEGERGTGGTD